MVPVWSQYFANACCLLYVFSLNATGQLAAAVVELQGVIEHADMQVRMLCCHLGNRAVTFSNLAA